MRVSSFPSRKPHKGIRRKRDRIKMKTLKLKLERHLIYSLIIQNVIKSY